MSDPSSPDHRRLRGAGIRPTYQRLAVARLLREGGQAHVTADEVFRQAGAAGLRVSLATVYNALNDFAKAGLLRRIDLGDKTTYCANTQHHHHFLDLGTGRLSDIPDPQPRLAQLPALPPGMEIDGIDIIVRLRRV